MGDLASEFVELLLVVHVEIEAVGGVHPFLNDLHVGFRGLFAFDCLFNQPMDSVEVDSALPDQVVIAHDVFVPYLHCEDVRIHLFRFGWVVHIKLPAPVERPLSTTAPVHIGLLWVVVSDVASHEKVVAALSNVLEDTAFGPPNYHPKFILVVGRSMYFLWRHALPVLPFNEIDPHFKPTLRTPTVVAVEVAQFDGFALQKMPMPG